MVFAEEGSPAFFAGAFDVVQSTDLDELKVAEAFRTGKGVGWHEHSKCLFSGTERFFRPGYNANLVQNWIPSLDGVEAKLKTGAKVADVGCGHGASTIVMAQAYPKSQFFGFDYHQQSLDRAASLAKKAGVGDRIVFKQASAKDFPAKGCDLVAFFDCLHDMGDPVGAGKHVKQTLGRDGAWMIVEPFAHDNLKDNLNPVGRVDVTSGAWLAGGTVGDDGPLGPEIPPEKLPPPTHSISCALSGLRHRDAARAIRFGRKARELRSRNSYSECLLTNE